MQRRLKIRNANLSIQLFKHDKGILTQFQYPFTVLVFAALAKDEDVFNHVFYCWHFEEIFEGDLFL